MQERRVLALAARCLVLTLFGVGCGEDDDAMDTGPALTTAGATGTDDGGSDSETGAATSDGEETEDGSTSGDETDTGGDTDTTSTAESGEEGDESSSTGGSGDSCAPVDDDSACRACLRELCCTTLESCLAHEPCACWLECIEADGMNCQSGCNASNTDLYPTHCAFPQPPNGCGDVC